MERHAAYAASEANGPGSYAQWVRTAIAQMADARQRAIALFDSSVPEPVDQLRGTIAAGFGNGVTSRYVSVFLDGNPYVVQRLQARYDAPAEGVLCTTGATGALSLLYRTYLKAGDRVLVEHPGFDLFADLARIPGVAVDRFERDAEHFSIDPARIAAAIRPGTRLIVLSNLHNPSGDLAGEDVLLEISAIASRHGVTVVVDEVYRDYAGPSGGRPAARLAHNLVSVSSLTKIYGLSTLRCGWLAGHPDIVAPVRELSNQVEFGVSKLGHAVAALVLESQPAYDAYWQQCLAEARPVLEAHHRLWREEGLMSGTVPAFGCVYFPRVVGVDDTRQFSAWLAERFGVVVVPGEFFGRGGHVRIGFASSAEALRAGLDRVTEGLRLYRHRASR